jgi:TRAP transporter TAXI family solute receptor
VLAEQPARGRGPALDRHRRLGRRLPGLRRRRGRDAVGQRARHDRGDDIDAVKGQDSFDHALPLRALGTLYSNFTHVVAKKDSGIETIEDLKGKTVSIGAPNSGTEVIGLRLMQVAGLDPDSDVTRRAMGVAALLLLWLEPTVTAIGLAVLAAGLGLHAVTRRSRQVAAG